MENILKKEMRNNLISKKTGIGDHMIADEITDIIFPNEKKYNDIISNEQETKYGLCIKNQYRTIDWIKKIIALDQWGKIGKERSLYEYFVDCDNINKPNLKNYDNEEQLYDIASGDMQFDFDDLSDELIEDIKQAFITCGKKNPCYHWFEYSWSGHGCHVRVYAKLYMKNKLEWGFWYIHLLNGILKYVNKKNRTTIIEHIDWSCANVTRGFAIPYNKGGVLIGEKYNENEIVYIKNEDELDNIFKNVSFEWYDELYEYYTKKFINPHKKKQLIQMGIINEDEGFKYTYSMEEDWEFDENHPMVDGETYNYNWRLSLVTTLMGVFNKDKDIVRDICAVIYKYIREYKNHTYDEMLHNELEHKIFNRANFNLEPSHEILKELWNDWGLKIVIRRKYT